MMEIRKLKNQEIPGAMRLVWEVFQEFEATDYSEEGVNTFKNVIVEQEQALTMEMYGAFESGDLLGVIATRNHGSHISLFFVKKEHHQRGIGRMLFEHILSHKDSNIITVNSSPYAVKIYRKLGFSDTAGEQVSDGIRYTPMRYNSGK